MLHAPISDYPLWAKVLIGGAVGAAILKDKVVAGGKAIGRKVKKAVGGKYHAEQG